MKGISLLSALSRGRNLFGYVPYPDYVLEGFYKKAIDNGLNVMRIFDALNDIDNIRESVKMINSLGGDIRHSRMLHSRPERHTGRGSQKKRILRQTVRRERHSCCS